ncbi:unnamed protein product, partial [Owenia fusiformis]
MKPLLILSAIFGYACSRVVNNSETTQDHVFTTLENSTTLESTTLESTTPKNSTPENVRTEITTSENSTTENVITESTTSENSTTENVITESTTLETTIAPTINRKHHEFRRKHWLPYFKDNTPSNTSVDLGGRAKLTCHVGILGTRTVIWKRSSDNVLLTVGLFTFVYDERIRAEHNPGSNESSLIIENAKLSDDGIYECRVSSKTPVVWKVRLTVQENATPENVTTESTTSESRRKENVITESTTPETATAPTINN